MPATSAPPTLALVIPCYNEQEVIATTLNELSSLMKKMQDEALVAQDSFMVFVDDGSKDQTFSILQKNKAAGVRVVKLARNVGHQAALLAGLHFVTGKVDCCISIDADLQDDTEAIPEMVKKFSEGAQIVFGVRSSRKTDTLFKKGTAGLFYGLMTRMGIPLIDNHADFRLLSNQVLVELGRYREVNLFLRGIFPQMGFPTAIVEYARKKREAGESKYPFWKMVRLAVNGITSFTNYPLKIITAIGLVVFLGSFAATLWVLYVVLMGMNVPGWASITLPVYFLGGVQLLSLGIIGEYISKIYLETKQRPYYHIEKVLE